MLIGVDTGGTFTDFVIVEGETVRLHKVLSTPDAPERAILEGLAELGIRPGGAARIVHGSTVATNAALEGQLARTVYVADRGLADVLTLGRQDRAHLYDLTPPVAPPPVEPSLCVEVDARLGADGEVVRALDDSALARVVEAVRDLAPEAVAINLLFNWLDDTHEARLQAALEDTLDDTTFVTRSSFVLPEYREYERGMATWLNASLGPRVRGYLDRLGASLAPAPVAIMQSAGGTIAIEVASRRAVNLLLSGPAGGLAAAGHIARATGIERLLTFDMGGTSTDVALVEGEPVLTTDARIGPWPVAVPMLDIHTIGAGGGSLATLDAGGALQVGPASAGADPGPVCYGRGGQTPTVTDANLVTGRLPASAALGGHMRMDVVAAREALAALGASMGFTGTDAAERAARGVLELADEHMAQALRVMSIERGVDPRSATLCCFGGAGGLHLCAIAERLGMREAMVPVHAGVLSALGMLVARPERQLSRTVARALAATDPSDLEDLFATLETRGAEELRSEGHDPATFESDRSIDLRYEGQAFALPLPWDAHGESTFAAGLHATFEAAHEARYGHRLDAAVEIETLRVRMRAAAPELPGTAAEDSVEVPPIVVQSRSADGVPVLPRSALERGSHLEGPAIVTEDTSTTWLAPGWTLRVDGLGNLRLERT